jgi:hypothetical protein
VTSSVGVKEANTHRSTLLEEVTQQVARIAEPVSSATGPEPM